MTSDARGSQPSVISRPHTTEARPALVTRQAEGGAAGWPRRLLKLEGLAVLALCVALYAGTGASWWMFGGLFLVPDLSFAAYWADRRLGALAYNLTHAEVGPILLGVFGLTVAPACLPVALIWGAQVGWDRMLGYGLKYASSFHHTHLGPVGPAART